MSTDGTGAAQHDRLRRLGHSVTTLPTLVDMDTADDLPAVTASGSAIRTAALARRIGMLPVATVA